MFKLRSANLGDSRRPFYSEYVYGNCLAVWEALNGANGCRVGDFVDIETIVAPRRVTALHELISGVIGFLDGETFYDWPDLELDTHRAVVLEAGLAYPSDAETRVIEGDYSFEDKSALYGVIAEATEQVVLPSVFHALFSDRNFIHDFQGHLRTLLLERQHELPEGVLTRKGHLRRVHLPVWLKKGIFFRDQGVCQLCGADISGLKSPFDEVHIDHIVPLAQSGNNDPTNFQLLCRSCNLGKGATFKPERSRFMPYWKEA